MSRAIGQTQENVACHYLQEQGLKLLQRNFSCRQGEIDLIMEEGNYIVFVEVRYRKNDLYGSGLDTISIFKQKKIITTAKFFLTCKPWYHKWPCRFDVLSIGKDITWIRDAFRVC